MILHHVISETSQVTEDHDVYVDTGLSLARWQRQPGPPRF